MPYRKLGIMWDTRFSDVNFGAEHPVQGNRFQKTFELLGQLGVVHGNVEVHPVDLVTEEELLLVHTPAYVKSIKKLSETGIGEVSKDTPAFRGMHDYSLLCVGATLSGAKLAVEKRFPFVSMVGGYHHAFPDKGGGFNIYNDLAITAKWFLTKRLIERILILDTDVHHGNGTQSIFYQSPNVFTISFHETGESIYPGTGSVTEIGEKEGKGYNINFPFEPGSASSDIELEWAFRKIIPKIIRTFAPEIIIWQAGVDAHIDDPLSNLRFTTRGFKSITKILLDAIGNLHEKLIVVAGGGYHLESAIWSYASIISILAGKEIDVPEDVDQYRYASPNAIPRAYVFEQLRLLEKHIPFLA